LRNTALGKDYEGRIWGVDNNLDELFRADIGGDIHNDNPGEEVNIFDFQEGLFYGYPYCWSEGILNSSYAKGPGSQWSLPDPRFNYTDEFCDNTTNVVKPVWVLPAHTAPLDITFCNTTSFPAEYQGNVFIALHGSWDRTNYNGYRVERLILDPTTNLPISEEPFLYYSGSGWRDVPYWIHRPVNLAWAKCPFGECLFFSSEEANAIIGIAFTNETFPYILSSSSKLSYFSWILCWFVICIYFT